MGRETLAAWSSGYQIDLTISRQLHEPLAGHLSYIAFNYWHVWMVVPVCGNGMLVKVNACHRTYPGLTQAFA